MPPDASQLETDRGQVTKSGNGRYTGKARPLTRENLDRRTKAAQQFDAVARTISDDLGGEEQLSAIQKHLVEAFAGVAVHLGDLHARLLLGEKIDFLAHSNAVSTMVRIASRVGVRRIPRDVTPSLSEVMHEHEEAEQ